MTNLTTVLNKFKENKYNIENPTIEDEEEFFDICTEFMEAFEDLQKKFLNKNNISNYSEKEREEFWSRMYNVASLNEELNDLYNIDGTVTTGNNPIEYTKRMAIFTEMSNDVAHLVEKYMAKNNLKKDRNLRDIKEKLFDLKQAGVTKMIDNSMGREKDGIIAGIIKDNTKSENSNVFVIDIAGTGQVSWHISMDTLEDDAKNKLIQHKYPFKVDKENPTDEATRNKDLLKGLTDDKHLSVHNKIDANIPQGCEDELKLALEIYYEVVTLKKNETDAGLKGEEKVVHLLRQACLKHGLPSKETFDMLLDKMVDTVFDDTIYDKDNLRDWRDKEDERER